MFLEATLPVFNIPASLSRKHDIVKQLPRHQNMHHHQQNHLLLQNPVPKYCQTCHHHLHKSSDHHHHRTNLLMHFSKIPTTSGVMNLDMTWWIKQSLSQHHRLHRKQWTTCNTTTTTNRKSSLRMPMILYQPTHPM